MKLENATGTDRAELATCLMKVVGGDRGAFEDLYRRTSAKLFGVCLRISGERFGADEALQETYLLVWRRAGSFDPAKGSAMTWLITLARNCAIDRLRAGGRLPLATLDLADDVPDAAASAHDMLEDDEDGRALARCIGTLRADDVRLITAAFYEGSTYADLAGRTNVPLGTVKSRIRRALMKLRECLR